MMMSISVILLVIVQISLGQFVSNEIRAIRAVFGDWMTQDIFDVTGGASLIGFGCSPDRTIASTRQRQIVIDAIRCNSNGDLRTIDLSKHSPPAKIWKLTEDAVQKLAQINTFRELRMAHSSNLMFGTLPDLDALDRLQECELPDLPGALCCRGDLPQSCAESLLAVTGRDRCEPCCSNGLQDWDEDGIDCGSVCNNSCPSPPQDGTCEDNIQNGNEEGIDCGGRCSKSCCANGKHDVGEIGVDCGGNCAECQCTISVGNLPACSVRNPSDALCRANRCETATLSCRLPLLVQQRAENCKTQCANYFYGWSGKHCRGYVPFSYCEPGTSNCLTQPNELDAPTCEYMSTPSARDYAFCDEQCQRTDQCQKGAPIQGTEQLQNLCFVNQQTLNCNGDRYCNEKGLCVESPRNCKPCEAYNVANDNCVDLCGSGICQAPACSPVNGCDDIVAEHTVGACLKYTAPLVGSCQHGKDECLQIANKDSAAAVCGNAEQFISCGDKKCARLSADKCSAGESAGSVTIDDICFTDGHQCGEDEACMRDGHCVAIEHVEVFVKYVGTTSVNEPIITALAAAIRDKLRNDGVDFAKENVKVLPEAVQLSIKEPLRWRIVSMIVNPISVKGDRKRQDSLSSRFASALSASLANWQAFAEIPSTEFLSSTDSSMITAVSNSIGAVTTSNGDTMVAMTTSGGATDVSNTASSAQVASSTITDNDATMATVETVSDTTSTVNEELSPGNEQNMNMTPPTDSDNMLWIIIGAVAGAVVLILLIVCSVCIAKKRSQKDESGTQFDTFAVSTPASSAYPDPETVGAHTESIYAAAPPMTAEADSGRSDQIYGAAPTLAFNDGGMTGEYGAAPPIADAGATGEYGAAPPAVVNYDVVPPESK